MEKEEWKVVVRDIRVFSFDENNKLLKTREMKGEVLIVRKPSVAVNYNYFILMKETKFK